MSLDFHIKCDDGFFFFHISEGLHSSIFSSSTRWSGFKNLRKIKDYYRTDVLFKSNDAVSFLNEFIDICERNSLECDEMGKIKLLASENNIDYVRVSGD